jgi:hypothetical protein
MVLAEFQNRKAHKQNQRETQLTLIDQPAHGISVSQRDSE